jgi:hypothetical protein
MHDRSMRKMAEHYRPIPQVGIRKKMGEIRFNIYPFQETHVKKSIDFYIRYGIIFLSVIPCFHRSFLEGAFLPGRAFLFRSSKKRVK